MWLVTQVGFATYGLTPATISGVWFGSPVRALSFVTAGVRGAPLRFWRIRPTCQFSVRLFAIPLPEAVALQHRAHVQDMPAVGRAPAFRELDVRTRILNGSMSVPGMVQEMSVVGSP